MENLKIYSKLKTVPSEAKKPIHGGRLKGMTDINPMWRIKALTETFGVCGFGWRYEILEERLESTPTEEVAAFVRINLYVKLDGEWSDAIPGTGGSAFVTKESRGLYVSDECFKMALTDALGVAMKPLGMAADVYFEKDRTKYTKDEPEKSKAKEPNDLKPNLKITDTQYDSLMAVITEKHATDADAYIAKVTGYYKIQSLHDLTIERYGVVLSKLV